jgi:hypothetical protein
MNLNTINLNPKTLKTLGKQGQQNNEQWGKKKLAK